MKVARRFGQCWGDEGFRAADEAAAPAWGDFLIEIPEWRWNLRALRSQDRLNHCPETGADAGIDRAIAAHAMGHREPQRCTTVPYRNLVNRRVCWPPPAISLAK